MEILNLRTRSVPMTVHEQAVKLLSNHNLEVIIYDLRHSSDHWARCRRIAALDELEKRRTNKK